MNILKKLIIASTIIMTSTVALSQVSGSIGRAGETSGDGQSPSYDPGNPYDPNVPYDPDNQYNPDNGYNPDTPYDPYRPFPPAPPPIDRPDYDVTRITMNCGSSGGYNTCTVNGPILGINLLRQYSRSSCIEGVSYGVNYNTIWVDRGCEADFEVVIDLGYRPPVPRPGPRPFPPEPRPRPYPPGPIPRPGPRPHPHPSPTTQTVLGCSSINFGRNFCYVNGFGRILNVELVSVQSRSSCDYGIGYGFDEDNIWVDRGCRATFRVTKGTYR